MIFISHGSKNNALVIGKMTFTQTFTFKATPPFDFDLTAKIFGSVDKQIRTYSNGQFSVVLRLNGKLMLTKLTSKGTVEKPKIACELKSNSPITAQDLKKAQEAIQFIFNLDFNLCTFLSRHKK
jgi:hypothetical protein